MAFGNSVNDEIREQHKRVLEQEGFKGRLKYFAHYYKWHVIIALIVIVFFGTSKTQGKVKWYCNIYQYVILLKEIWSIFLRSRY